MSNRTLVLPKIEEKIVASENRIAEDFNNTTLIDTEIGYQKALYEVMLLL